MLRRCRNLICQASLFSVVVIDPVAQFLLSAPKSQLLSTALAKVLVLTVGLVYTLSLMWEETKQNHDLRPQRSPSADSMQITGKRESKFDFNKLFASKVKEYSQKTA